MEETRTFVIYKHPKDFPDKFVVRQWHTRPLNPNECTHCKSDVFWVNDVAFVQEPIDPPFLFDDLDAARACAGEDGRTRIPRLPGDDEKIVEVWL